MSKKTIISNFKRSLSLGAQRDICLNRALDQYAEEVEKTQATKTINRVRNMMKKVVEEAKREQIEKDLEITKNSSTDYYSSAETDATVEHIMDNLRSQLNPKSDV